MLYHTKIGEQLKAESRWPGIVLQFQEASLRGGAGVGDEDIEAAPDVCGLPHNLSSRIGKSKVERCGANLGREFSKLRARLVELVAAAGNEQDLRAAFRKAARDPLADPAAGTGYENTAVLKRPHRPPR